MLFTYDPATDAGKVRLLARDTVEAAALFNDAEIDAFLAIHAGDVRMAAAEALDAVASNQVLLLKKVKLGDIGTDGPAVAAALRTHAASLREQALVSSSAGGDGFRIVDMSPGGAWPFWGA